MSNELILKIKKGMCFILAFLSVMSACLCETPVYGACALWLSLLILTGLAVMKRYGFWGEHLISVYALFVGPLNLLVAGIAPDWLVMVEYNLGTFYDSSILFNLDLIIAYTVLLSVFYACSVLFFILLLRINFKLPIRLKCIRFLNIRSPIMIALVAAIIKYALRITFSLNIPGQSPTIPMAGVIVYLLQAIDAVLFCQMLRKAFGLRRGYARTMKYAIVGLLAVSLDSILIGQRGAIISYAVILIMMFMFYALDEKKLNTWEKELTKAERRKVYLYLCEGGVIALIFMGVTVYVRTGTFEVLSFVLKRIIGLYDGSIALSHILSQGIPFGLNDYFMTIFRGVTETSNNFYTHTILGYPTTAIHGSSIPVFITSAFYGGVIGVVIIAFVESFMIVFGSRLLNKGMALSMKGDALRGFHSLYVALLLLVKIFFFHIMEGNVTSWKDFVVPMVCYMVLMFMKDPIRSTFHRKEVVRID